MFLTYLFDLLVLQFVYGYDNNKQHLAGTLLFAVGLIVGCIIALIGVLFGLALL